MKFRSGMALALGASLVLGGCAAGAAGGGGPETSPTGKVYAPGTRPSESDFTAPAKLFLAQEAYQNALEQALQGIEADSTNPQHYFLAGSAYAGLGDFAAADSMWDRAQEIYPAYELEIEPAREQAWANAFNEGVTAYNSGNLDAAVEAWTRANEIYTLRPEGYLNLAIIYTQRNEHDRAIEAYRAGLAAVEQEPQTRELTPEEVTERTESRAEMLDNLARLLIFTEQYAEAEEVYRQMLETDPTNVGAQSSLALALAKQGREAEAEEIYNQLLGDPNLASNELFNIGVALFNSQDFVRAADAFRRVTEMSPNSRDAWYNYANALYAQEDFAALVPVAERLMEVDPLNENAALILARAYRDTDQNDKALATLQANEAMPVHLNELQLRPGDGESTVRGTVIGNQAAAGTPVQIRFTFYDEGSELGSQTVTVTAPEKDATTSFEVVLQNPTPATAYRYEVVG